MDLAKYKGIIFDMDGTLVDSMPAHLNAWQATCEAFDIPFDREWFYTLGGMPTIKTAYAINEKYQLDCDPVLLAESKLRLFDDIPHKGDVIPATFNVLKQQKALSKKIAIGTGCQRRHADELLEVTGLMPYLDAVVTSNDVENHKPNPDTFLEAAKRIGVEPKDCIVFEDTELGRSAAISAGMDCYLVTDGLITEFKAA
jgi:beta-phosphoglucomutase family hydrolase